jgi:hypothetical protein
MGLLQGGEVSDEWIDVSGGVVVSARTTFVAGLGSGWVRDHCWATQVGSLCHFETIFARSGLKK